MTAPGVLRRAVCLIALCIACVEENGASSPSAATDAYLAAMGRGDPAALRRIVPPDFDAEQAIAEKLRKYVGLDVSSLRTEYVPNDVTPNHVRVVITGDTPPFGDVIFLERRGRQGWYVALGRLRGFTPGPTAQIRPP